LMDALVNWDVRVARCSSSSTSTTAMSPAAPGHGSSGSCPLLLL
jgi:hypothetical protein